MRWNIYSNKAERIVQGEAYRSIAKGSSFAAASIIRSTKYEKPAPMAMMRTRVSEIVAETTRDIRQRGCCKEELGSLERGVQHFKNVLIETFGELCDIGMHSPKHRIVNHMEKAI